MTTSVALSPVAILQFFDNTGKPAIGGSLLTQSGGVNYPTYSEPTGTTALPNPIPLNSRGECSTAAGASSPLFLQTGVAYTFTLKDSAGNQLWSIGNITSINGQAVSFPTAGGTANAQTVTNAVPISLGSGVVQWFLPAAANTGATTLNVDGTGAKNVFYLGAALVGAELKTTVPAEVTYDGTQWNLVASANTATPQLVQTNKYTYFADTGAVNALVITPVPAITAYADGQSWLVKIANTTTNSTPTIAVGGLATKNLYYPDGTTQILAGALILNNIYRMTYDSSLNAAAGAFIVESPSSITGSFTISQTGTTVTQTGTATYRISSDSKLCSLMIPILAGTSNATTMTWTGIPAIIQPSGTANTVYSLLFTENNGAWAVGTVNPTNASTWNVYPSIQGTTWNNTGTKATGGPESIVFPLG